MPKETLQQSNEKIPLLGNNQHSFFSISKKVLNLKNMFIGLAILNGILYFAVARAGGNNVERIFNFHGTGADVTMDIISGGSSLCYTMFFYKTLESLSLIPKNTLEVVLSLLAPFAASSFYSAGVEGAEALSIPREAAITIGVVLFFLRMVNCVDGSTKFPSRLDEMHTQWKYAWENKDYKELSRLIVTGLVSLGYSAASTDAIYNASMSFLRSVGCAVNPLTSAISYVVSVLGAIGTLPMTLYWTHRGLKQLTYGGTIKDDGTNPDPSDKYTYAGLPIVSTVILGIIGSATGTHGTVFGRLGIFANCVRVASSTIYAIAAATPGIATLLRGTFKKRQISNLTVNVDPEYAQPSTSSMKQIS